MENTKNTLKKITSYKSIFIPLLTFIIIISLFFMILNVDRNQALVDQKLSTVDHLLLIDSKLVGELNKRIQNVQGMAAYVQINPEMTNEDFTAFASKLIDEDDPIIRNVSLVKDTTITFVYPFKSNEKSIGVNLALIEDQKNDIFYVRDSGVTLMTSPVDLVQGGKGIIVRIPIYLKNQNSKYWGQIGLVINYDALLDESGISSFEEEYYLSIDQYDQNNVYQHQIISTDHQFSNTSTSIIVALPDSQWHITAEKKSNLELSSFFYFTLILGITLSLLIPLGIHNIFSTNDNLNRLVAERTSKLFETNEYLEQSLGELQEQQSQMILLNNQLQDSLDTLEETQHQLILNEKLASLGELVASVAHEINTPLGICVTLTTYLHENEKSLQEYLETDTLTRSNLVSLNDDNLDVLKVVIQNLLRASDLVSSFKMVAVDQHLDDYRQINLKEYITDVTKSLGPKIKKTSHTLSLDIEEEIDFYTYPGALSQIVTNLVMNSILHGFKDRDGGHMTFKSHTEDDDNIIVLEYTDDGKGIPEENIGKVFNPFYTTGKSSGSTGLGLHIIHNLIIQMLKGRITLESEENKGVKFTILIPYSKEIDPDMINA